MSSHPFERGEGKKILVICSPNGREEELRVINSFPLRSTMIEGKKRKGRIERNTTILWRHATGRKREKHPNSCDKVGDTKREKKKKGGGSYGTHWAVRLQQKRKKGQVFIRYYCGEKKEGEGIILVDNVLGPARNVA